MGVNDWYLFQGVGNVIGFQRVVGPRLLGLAPDEAVIEAAMPKAQAVFAELSRLLGDQPYFTGEAISLADLMLAPQVAFFTETPEWAVLGAPRANLAGWLERMEARPSLQATTWERGRPDGSGRLSRGRSVCGRAHGGKVELLHPHHGLDGPLRAGRIRVDDQRLETGGNHLP